MKQTLLIVSAKADAGLSNEILHLIREDEEKGDGGFSENNLRILTMNEEQWRLHRNAVMPKVHVLFIGRPAQGLWLHEDMAVRFEKFGIRYGWSGRYTFLYVEEKALKDHQVYDRFLKELKALCTLEDVIQSQKAGCPAAHRHALRGPAGPLRKRAGGREAHQRLVCQ